jgi:hypothetical protein
VAARLPGIDPDLHHIRGRHLGRPLVLAGKACERPRHQVPKQRRPASDRSQRPGSPGNEAAIPFKPQQQQALISRTPSPRAPRVIPFRSRHRQLRDALMHKLLKARTRKTRLALTGVGLAALTIIPVRSLLLPRAATRTRQAASRSRRPSRPSCLSTAPGSRWDGAVSRLQEDGYTVDVPRTRCAGLPSTRPTWPATSRPCRGRSRPMRHRSGQLDTGGMPEPGAATLRTKSSA